MRLLYTVDVHVLSSGCLQEVIRQVEEEFCKAMWQMSPFLMVEICGVVIQSKGHHKRSKQNKTNHSFDSSVKFISYSCSQWAHFETSSTVNLKSHSAPRRSQFGLQKHKLSAWIDLSQSLTQALGTMQWTFQFLTGRNLRTQSEKCITWLI